jgi:hypothetical protein
MAVSGWPCQEIRCRLSSECSGATAQYLSKLLPQNVSYDALGFAARLGAAGRSGGLVPTITGELTGLNFSVFFPNGLLGFSPIQIQAMKTAVTGEDLSTVGS